MLKNIKKISYFLITFLILFSFFSYNNSGLVFDSSFALAQTSLPGGGTTTSNPDGTLASGLVEGDIYGWAWTAANIVPGANSPQGGGGWVNFNCKPNCPGGSSDWGVKMAVSHLDPVDNGTFVGQAWSTNFGWLSFDYDVTYSCWDGSPYVVPDFPARAMISGQTSGSVPVIGWAKFLAGDDDPNDGWDGCVSFNGANYGVNLNLSTGSLTGWAWGGPHVGWISFQNPECRFCNVGVVLPSSVSISFWADQTTVQQGGGTTLRWSASNSGSRFVARCPTYSNTSNYGHWKKPSLFGSSSNLDNITVNAPFSNLPTGSHPINGINQTTTYELNCVDNNNNPLPTQYVTINVTTDEILGCTNPNALNYNPSATQNDGSCIMIVLGCTNILATNYNPSANTDDGSCIIPNDPPPPPPPPSTNLNLQVNPISLVVGSGSYGVSLTWTSNNPSSLNSCVGGPLTGMAVTDAGNQTNWDGPRQSPNTTVPFNVNLAPYAASASIGQTIVFTLTCQSSDGPVSDTATVVMSDIFNPPSPANLNLHITNPNNNYGLTFEIIPQDGANVTLDWSNGAENINWSTCVGDSSRYNSSGVSLGESNNQWNNSTLYNAGPNSQVINMTSPNNISTLYSLNCQSTQGNILFRSVMVCIDGQICPMNPPGSGIPGYIEF